MPAAKVSREPLEELPGPHMESLDLLRWVGKWIMVRNQNGKVSDKFCLLCKNTRVRPMDCRHKEIWRLTGLERL
jgi:hypothetical protein